MVTRYRMTSLLVLAVCAFAVVYSFRSQQSEVAGLEAVERAIHAQGTTGYSARVQTRVSVNGRIQTEHLDVYANRGVTVYMPPAGVAGCTSLIRPSPSALGLNTTNQTDILSTKLLKRNYSVRMVGEELVAKRPSDKVILIPLHPGRPSLHLWIDRETGLPIRVRKYDSDNMLVAENTVMELKPGSKEIKVVKEACEKGCCGTTGPDVSPDKYFEEITDAQIRKELGYSPVEKVLLPGFLPAAKGIYNCACGCDMRSAVSHYTDGVASYSVFITPVTKTGCNSPECVPPNRDGKPAVKRLASGENMATWADKRRSVIVVGDLSKEEIRQIVVAQIRG